jgi:hypothetical protein
LRALLILFTLAASTGFRIVSGKSPEYSQVPKVINVPDKQHRYRNRKLQQGFSRVEVLVPSESIGHMKAYARALRDAHSLGSAFPLFEGMTSTPIPSKAQSEPSPAAVARRPTSAPPKPKPKPKPSHPAKPDFSGGILGSDPSKN